jgi:hypothetical protein
MMSLEHFNNLNGQLWTAVLLVQSTPYAASLCLLLINVTPNFKLSLLQLGTPVPIKYDRRAEDKIKRLTPVSLDSK